MWQSPQTAEHHGKGWSKPHRRGTGKTLIWDVAQYKCLPEMLSERANIENMSWKELYHPRKKSQADDLSRGYNLGEFLEKVALRFSVTGGWKRYVRVTWMWEGDLGVWWEECRPEAVVFLVHRQSHLWPWERKLGTPAALQLRYPHATDSCLKARSGGMKR